MSETTRGVVLYKRALAFAKAAFVAAGLMILAAAVSLACASVVPDWFDKVQPHVPGGVENLNPLAVIGVIVRTWVESAFLIAGVAILTLVAARAVAADSRPSWAPLIDEKFARWADIFALLALGYAVLSLFFAGYSIVTVSLNIVTGSLNLAAPSITSPAAGLHSLVVVQLVTLILDAAYRFFLIVGGALIIQSLVAVATSDYSRHAEESRDGQ